MPNDNKMRFGMMPSEMRVVVLALVGFILTGVLFFAVLSSVDEHTSTLTTLWGMAIGFFVKFGVFGWAAGIMFRQKGTSKLAVAVKWFFVTMSVQDIIVSALYAAAAIDAWDNSTDLSMAWRTATRALGVQSVFMVAAVGIFFILVLSKRVRVLIEYEERDGQRHAVDPSRLERRIDTRYDGEDSFQ